MRDAQKHNAQIFEHNVPNPRASSSRIRYRNELTEKAWEDAVHGLGNARSYARRARRL